MMAGIRGKNTKPEKAIRSALWRHGFRFRVHQKCLPGRPDIVIPKWKAVIQVQGCFWHGHVGCRYFRYPATRRAFWKRKIVKNRLRDRKTSKLLECLGFRSILVWECALRDDPDRTVRLLKSAVPGKKRHVEIRSIDKVARLISR
jgi:DNA mismatch endonuclease (patch repair protein)